MTVGYDPFAQISLSSTSSRKFTHATQATLLTSGVETSEAWITLDEDPTTRAGVPSSFDFAVLLQRSEEAEGFEVELRCVDQHTAVSCAP